MSIFINQGGITLYQALHPETLPVNITEPELVLESELPDRLEALNNKTQNINEDGTELSDIVTLNGNKIGAPDTFKYNDVTPFIPVCDTAGVTEVGRYIDFHDASASQDFYTRLMCMGQNILEIAGVSSMRLSRIDVTIGISLRPGFALMKFTKSDNSTNLLTLDATTNEATFLGNVIAPNITSLEDKTQNILRIPGTDEDPISYTEIDGVSFQTTLGRISNTEDKLTKVSYTPFGELTTISGNLSVVKLNDNNIGSPDVYRYDNVTPFLPVVGSDGIMEVGARIDFHRATNEEDYTVGIEVKSTNLLSVRHTNPAYAGDLEVGTTYFRNTSGTCLLRSNNSSNMLWHNNAGTLLWICDATSSGERWSTTRDNALFAFTRTTGMTYTPAVVEPSPAPAVTNFTGNINVSECYAGRFHTNSTSSLPINSVTSASNWGAIRIQRTGLAQNTPCGYQFGRGNDTTNMPNNYCAMYYVSPTTDNSKGEIRIGVETEASTSSSNCITFDTDTKVTKFPANIDVPYLNGYKIGYEVDVNSIPTIINNYLNIANVIHFLARDIDPEPFNPDYHGYLKFTSPNTLTLIEGDGPSRIVAKNITDLETSITGITQTDITKTGTIIGSNVLSNNETRLANIETKTTSISYNAPVDENPSSIMITGNLSITNNCVADNVLSTNKTDIETLQTSMTGITQTSITKSETIIGSNVLSNNETRLSTIETNLEGLSYVESLLLQSSDTTQATVLRQHLFIDLAGKTYVPHMGMRAHKTDLASTQEMMIQVGKNASASISFVYRFNDTTADRQYRLDFAGKSAYSCKYGATSATEPEIKGNLTVFGTVTENASKTITHYTIYEGELQPGCFVETTGQIFRNPNSKLSPYEDCITVVRQATTSSNKIVGVCTEIINEEVTDDYGNINQPAGKYCKYATHGDVLIKCISAVYNVGEILIPTVNGYAKKGQQGEILDAMLNMIPRAKITSVETAEIDSESVCAFISI